MADFKSSVNPLFLREEELRQGIEMLFFAYRDFSSAPDDLLSRHGLGRAHHRVIYFVGRHPSLSVGELLEILKITKQSLGRVLQQLVEKDVVEQRPGILDRRKRLLHLTEKGMELERHLTERQRAVIARAYRKAGADAVEGFRKVLLGMIGPEDLARFDRPLQQHG